MQETLLNLKKAALQAREMKLELKNKAADVEELGKLIRDWNIYYSQLQEKQGHLTI